MRTCIKVLAAALSVSTGILMAAMPAEAAGKTKTRNITFDGFCSGMQVTVFPWKQVGTVETGCTAGLVGAGLVGKVGNGVGIELTVGENPNVSGEVYLWNIQYPLVTGGTWSLYDSKDGVTFTLQSSGTYTVVGN